MQKIEINTQEVIKKMLPAKLVKELKDNEMICSVCNGLGLVKRNQPYGIQNERTISWYDNEFVAFCPNCYFGVVKLCEYCHKPLPKLSKACNCSGSWERQQEKVRIDHQKMVEKAQEVKIENLSEDMHLYNENADEYYSEIEDFVDSYLDFEDWNSKEDLFAALPDVLWLTTREKIHIDAESIVESACEDLHEDAFENVDNMKELQKMLDDWCADQTGTDTLYPDYTKYVRVQKEWFNEI